MAFITNGEKTKMRATLAHERLDTQAFHERLAVVERMLKEGRLRALETYRPKTDAPNNGQLSARTMAILGLERCAAPTTLRDSATRPTPKPSSSRSTRRDVWRGQTPFEDSLE